MINADALWDAGYTGQGIVVAGMDTGVDAFHGDLASQFRGGTNSWMDVNGQYPSPVDPHGHGTQTMGIILGGDPNAPTIGVAPGAEWIAVKIFDDSDPPETTVSKIHDGFQWLLDPDGDPNTDDAPDIVNNSWGIVGDPNVCYLEFYDDIDILKTASIAVVFAAGNEGPGSGTSIIGANFDNAFSVGAVDSSFTVTDFSSRGPSPCHSDFFPQVVAPGKGIRTSTLTSGVFPHTYAYVEGTSFAAPHISGAMALLLSANETLSVWQLETVLKLSAMDLGIAGPDHNYGYGIVDLGAAFDLSTSICRADLDGGWDVNIADFEVLVGEWARFDCGCASQCQSDFNEDGRVDIEDFAYFASQFGRILCP
jgi:bacillopeptidase F